jgi:predicted enzyme related to lactoylglutathione lyase
VVSIKEATMSNPFTYCELHTTNTKQATDFYGKLFDWKLDRMETSYGGYTMIQTGGTGGGLMAQQDTARPSAWLVYVAVDDVEKMTARAKSLGATVQATKTEVKGHGWFSVVTDPTGATFALWENLEKK